MFLLPEELKILKKYAHDDFVWQYDIEDSPGWKNNISCTWIKGFHRTCGMEEDAFLDILYGLVDKNIIKIYNNMFFLTDYGKQIFEIDTK